MCNSVRICVRLIKRWNVVKHVIINNDITRTYIYTIWIRLYSESNSKVVFILKYTHSLNIIWVHVEVNTLFSLGCASCLYLIPLKGSKEALNTFDLPTRSHAHCIKRSKSSFQRMQSYLYQSLFKFYFSIIRFISLRIFRDSDWYIKNVWKNLL